MTQDNQPFADIYNKYKVNKKKKKTKVGDWVIVDEPVYNQYKDKIKLQNIKEYNGKNATTGLDEKIILAETKDKYILIKYNANFVAINICEREYELYNAITLLMVNDNAISNIENNKGKPLPIKEIIGVLGWKASIKAITNLEQLE